MEHLHGHCFQHYKTSKLYKFIDVARHSETLEEMVVYQQIEDKQVWVRPKEMFFEEVTYEGKQVPRFKEVEI